MTMSLRSVVVLFCLSTGAFSGRLRAMSDHRPANREESRPTSQRLLDKAWWPTSGKAASADYAGAQSCAPCHKSIASSQQNTPMAHAAWRASDTRVLTLNPRISSTQSGFETILATTSHGSTYSVRRGGEVMSGQVLWSMGDGKIASTFELQSGADFYESQLSYFTSIQGLDLTPAHTWSVMNGLQHAFGERQSPATVQNCFACHTTASSTRGRFDPAHATPGVTCEACHGPGARHVVAMQQGREDDGREAIFNPDKLSPADLADFCGACHRTPMDVKVARDFVPLNIRFQPYRLEKSRCWSQPDARLSCTACHNPHHDLVEDSRSYDANCLACHPKGKSNGSGGTEKIAGSAAKLAACPVGTERCVQCHMPRYQVPQMHASFTDHFIRIVRPGDTFPL